MIEHDSDCAVYNEPAYPVGACDCKASTPETSDAAMNADDNEPHCDKCGAPVTTGMMAMFCPAGKDCEFWVPATEDFKAMFSPTSNGASTK